MRHNKNHWFAHAEEKGNEIRGELNREDRTEKNDMPAMLLSAFLVIFPICLAVLVGLSLLILLLFRAL